MSPRFGRHITELALIVIALSSVASAAEASMCTRVLRAARGPIVETERSEDVGGARALETQEIGGLGRVGRSDFYDVQKLNFDIQATEARILSLVGEVPDLVTALEKPIELLSRAGLVRRSKWPSMAEREQAAETIRKAQDLGMKIEHQIRELEAHTLILTNQIVDLREVLGRVMKENASESQRLHGLLDDRISSVDLYARVVGLFAQTGQLIEMSEASPGGVELIRSRVALNVGLRERWHGKIERHLNEAVRKSEIWLEGTRDDVFHRIFVSRPNSGPYVWEYMQLVNAKEIRHSETAGTEYVDKRKKNESVISATNAVNGR